jgi:predicted secreted protein
MRIFVIAPLVLALAGSAMAQNADSGWPDLTPPVVVGDVPASVDLRVGQLLELRLPGRSGTPFSWRSAGMVPPCLEMVGEHGLRRLSDNNMAGGLKTQLIIYRAVSSCTGQLRVIYERSWEGGVQPARTVRYQVTVRG